MRVPWSQRDLQNLEGSLKAMGIIGHRDDLLLIINARVKEMQIEKISMSTLYSLERCLGEIVSEIMKVLEGNAIQDNKDFNLHILISQVEIPFLEMKELNIEYAYQVWLSWLVFLRGPKNKTTSPSPTLRAAIEFFDSQWTDIDQEALEIWRAKKKNFLFPSMN